MALRYVRYEAPGWGVGELVLDGERLIHSELPRPSTLGADGDHPLAARLRRYFAGEPVDFSDVEVDLGGETAFGRALAAELRRVPWGEVVAYGELAALAGRPGAARAAGSFCSRCGLTPVVPVHRVVAATGIGGFGASGVELKRRLLALEGVEL
jgi:methylated-DNA-[protein]-cysteine S-methyltransferase